MTKKPVGIFTIRSRKCSICHRLFAPRKLRQGQRPKDEDFICSDTCKEANRDTESVDPSRLPDDTPSWRHADPVSERWAWQKYKQMQWARKKRTRE